MTNIIVYHMLLLFEPFFPLAFSPFISSCSRFSSPLSSFLLSSPRFAFYISFFSARQNKKLSSLLYYFPLCNVLINFPSCTLILREFWNFQNKLSDARRCAEYVKRTLLMHSFIGNTKRTHWVYKTQFRWSPCWWTGCPRRGEVRFRSLLSCIMCISDFIFCTQSNERGGRLFRYFNKYRKYYRIHNGKFIIIFYLHKFSSLIG